jgi:hypothetical protein
MVSLKEAFGVDMERTKRFSGVHNVFMRGDLALF